MARPDFPEVRLAVEAMATRFELVLPESGGNPSGSALRAAGEMALAEVTAAEEMLSIYRPTAQLAQVNARAEREPVRVSAPVFELLQRAREGSERTGGAFDPTVGALVLAWRETDAGDPQWTQRLRRARACCGWRHVVLDADALTVRFLIPGVRLDLGSVGKGWALDRARETLREAGVTCALLHGGTSSVMAMGSPPGAEAWRIQIAQNPWPLPGAEGTVVDFPGYTVLLRDRTLSLSATWGRQHRDPQGTLHGHVLDPRTGEPLPWHRRAVVVGPSAADTDMLSTALLVAGPELIPLLSQYGETVRGWIE